MTLIVGIRCSDGIVMASDSAGALGTGLQWTIGQQEGTKVVAIQDTILYSATGSIGMAQLLIEKIRNAWNPGFFLNARAAEAMHRIGTTIAETVRVYASNAQAFQQMGGLQGFCRSLVALPVKDGPRLFQFDFTGIGEEATEELPCVALGSGQQIADPFLAFLRKILWKGRKPNLAEGRNSCRMDSTPCSRDKSGRRRPAASNGLPNDESKQSCHRTDGRSGRAFSAD